MILDEFIVKLPLKGKKVINFDNRTEVIINLTPLKPTADMLNPTYNMALLMQYDQEDFATYYLMKMSKPFDGIKRYQSDFYVLKTTETGGTIYYIVENINFDAHKPIDVPLSESSFVIGNQYVLNDGEPVTCIHKCLSGMWLFEGQKTFMIYKVSKGGRVLGQEMVKYVTNWYTKN